MVSNISSIDQIKQAFTVNDQEIETAKKHLSQKINFFDTFNNPYQGIIKIAVQVAEYALFFFTAGGLLLWAAFKIHYICQQNQARTKLQKPTTFLKQAFDLHQSKISPEDATKNKTFIEISRAVNQIIKSLPTSEQTDKTKQALYAAFTIQALTHQEANQNQDWMIRAIQTLSDHLPNQPPEPEREPSTQEKQNKDTIAQDRSYLQGKTPRMLAIEWIKPTDSVNSSSNEVVSDAEEKGLGDLLVCDTITQVNELFLTELEQWDQAFRSNFSLKNSISIELPRTFADRLEKKLDFEVDHPFKKDESRKPYLIGRLTTRQVIGIGFIVMVVAMPAIAGIALLYNPLSDSNSLCQKNDNQTNNSLPQIKYQNIEITPHIYQNNFSNPSINKILSFPLCQKSDNQTNNNLSQIRHQNIKITPHIYQDNFSNQLSKTESLIAFLGLGVSYFFNLVTSYFNLDFSRRKVQNLALEGSQEDFFESANLNIERNPILEDAETNSLDWVHLDDTQLTEEDRFKEYVMNHCGQISLEIAYGRALKGLKFYRSFYNGQIPIFPDHSDELLKEQLADMCWGFMFQACMKNQSFIEGTFDIRDEGYRIFNYFRPILYGRYSSHYKRRIIKDITDRSEWSHFGCDYEIGNLPAGKRSVMLGCINTRDGSERIYIKMENFGANLDVMQDPTAQAYCLHPIAHTAEFILSQSKHLAPSIFGEAGNCPDMHKEHILIQDKKKIQNFLTLISELFNISNSVNIEEYGFQDFILFLEKNILNLGNELNNEQLNLINRINVYLEELKERYDYLEYRKGDEVIINDPLENIL